MQELSVKAVTQMAGINASTLRAWERRYEALSPERTATGRRRYTVRQAERLRLLVELVNHGHAIGRIARLDDEALRHLLQNSLRHTRAISTEDITLKTAQQKQIAEVLAELEGYIRNFDLNALHGHLSRARSQFSAKVFTLDVVGGLMQRVGYLVSKGEINIAQEHALSAIIRVQLGEMIYSLNGNHSGATSEGIYQPSIALATQEGDLHEFGILMGALLCAANGIVAHYLGANLPPQPLAEATTALHADIVLIGNCPLPPGTLKISLPEYVDTVVKNIPRQTKIWIGGFARKEDLQRIREKHDVRHIAGLYELDEILLGLRVKTDRL